ncbi:hypothetical protein [Marinobacter nauticus]|uniref:Uncharacterized protein n=1 Tax=Marinobacter nauticus (strain ATCC 700491 / DSM 11845 / VT8) TaxID=351348 RepID=A1TZI7_MARN8|nr:hypothetical protein [Marinobacter nauticus]ABM18156.1 conserved hypothetical protein [Marinobacter nauticus VT8]
MQRIASLKFGLLGLTTLFLLPGMTQAGGPSPEHFLNDSAMVLEIRYCECQATEPGNAPTELRPAFLEQSRLLKVDVDPEGTGFVSSPEITLGFELKARPESPSDFTFKFAGHYDPVSQNVTGTGEVLLTKDQWLNLFSSKHERENNTEYRDVAVRLVSGDL